MPLSSLKIVGFKSFADPTTLNFAPGVTGIVGPNGSGKSNITEAVRWAMGEQSAKGLRGERMPDVIFAGTQLRPPLNLAEVTLIFDNRGRALKNDADTLEITRKIFRDGESEFYINKKACRLKDIASLFMDSGIGKESFSIISQGKVEAIFNSRAEDRRSIIEETAGVHQYKVQKDTALQKLQHTSDNLDRVADIVTEIEGRLEPLHEQSSLAKEYLEQKKAYDQLHKSWLVLNIDDKNQDKQTAQLKLHELKQTLQQLTMNRDRLTKALTTLKVTQGEVDQTLDEKQQILLTTTKDLEAQKGQLLVFTQQTDQSSDQLAEHEKSVQQLRTELQTLQHTGAVLQTKAQALLNQQQQLHDDIANLQQLAGHSKDDITKQIQARNDTYVDLLQRNAQIRNSIVMLTKQQSILDTQIQRIQTQQIEKQQQHAALSEQITQLTQAMATKAHAQESVVQKLAEIQAKVQAAQTTYQHQRSDLLNATQIYQQAQTKLASLKALQKEFTGFYQGPKYILKHRGQLPHVYGAVAELIEVPQRYQISIETTLGAQLQNIVVGDEQAAKQGIQLLRQQHQGRATFLPLNRIRQFNVAATTRAQLAHMAGFLGVASELVHFEDKFQPVVQHLLGTLLVVDTIDHGIALAQAIAHRYRIVTLKGDVISTSGAMSGGAAVQHSNNLLQQKQEIQQAQAQITAMDQALTAKQAQLKAQQTTVATLLGQQTHLQTQRNDQSTTTSSEAEKLTQLKTEADYISRELKTLAYNLDNSKQQQADLAQDLTQNQQEKAQLNATMQQTQTEVDQFKASLADYDSQQAEVTAKLNQALIQASGLKEQVKAKEQQVTANQQRQQVVTQQLRTLTEKITTIKAQSSQQVTSKTALKAAIKSSQDALKKTTATITQLQEQRRVQKTQIERDQNELTRQIELVEATRTEQATTEQTVKLLTRQIGEHLNDLEANYHESYEALKAKVGQLNGQDKAAMNQRLKLLKRGLDEIGPVNLNAIDDYQTTKSRYDFLTQQRDDLLTAQTTLMATIHELDQEVSARFEKTFNDVSKAFTTVFPQMFGGGHARLDLTDPADMLTTGVEIKASPPGKKLQRLSLLSGGERALTAITLLFAIIKVRPVPFCILDEVEASLDDTNVDRYADFMRAYDADTQFIVITHRKGTMMRANRLYGVTMEESGVSKIVSVTLTEQAASTES